MSSFPFGVMGYSRDLRTVQEEDTTYFGNAGIIGVCIRC